MTEQVTYDELTLFKVFTALRRVGIEQPKIVSAISEMQNSGILFRERVKDSYYEHTNHIHI